MKIKTRRFLIAWCFLFSWLRLLAAETDKGTMPKLNIDNTADTVYSGPINIHTSIEEFPLPGATVKFSILDSINQGYLLISEGVTDRNGELIIENLPIITNYVGIQEIPGQYSGKDQLVITNNGTASYHTIIIKSEQEFPKHGFIIDINGKVIESINLIFNPLIQAYEGYWNGTPYKAGTYIFYTEKKNGIVAGKIDHVSNFSGTQGQKYFTGKISSELNQNRLKESAILNSKYQIKVNSEVGKTFEQFVYIYEQTAHIFNLSIEHLPIANASVEGYVSVNYNTRISGANIFWSNLTSNISFELTTDTNGYFHKDDIPVPIDNDFTNPEKTRYYITVNIGDSIVFKVDPVTVISGELTSENFNINLVSEGKTVK